MADRCRWGLLVLVLAQAAHSGEEYRFRLYDRFAPARMISDLAGSDRATGFLLVNTALALFGLGCWLMLGRASVPARATILWGWALLELANGLGHLALAALSGGYFPGAGTAPLLILASGTLIAMLARRSPRSGA